MEKGMATHSSILAWRIPWTISRSCKELDATEWLSHNHISHSLTPEPRSPALNADSSPSEPPGEPPSSYQYEDHILLKWENTAQGLMRPYVLLLWSWHSRADHISPSWGGLQSPQCGRREYSQSTGAAGLWVGGILGLHLSWWVIWVQCHNLSELRVFSCKIGGVILILIAELAGRITQDEAGQSLSDR